MIVVPIFISLGAFAATFSGGLLAAKLHNRLGVLSAFAAGVLIAVPLFDLLPEAMAIATRVGISMSTVLYFTAAGFLFLYILERYVSVHRVCEDGSCTNVRHPKGGLFGAIELSAHSLMDGFAIGVAFRFSAQVGLVVAIAVLAHDFSLRSSLRMLLVDAAAPVLGVLISLVIKPGENFLVLILAFFAGGFLYLGAGDLLPEAHEQNPPLAAVAATLAGFALILAVVRLSSG
jgi:ZIP family zinc transporter